MADPATDPSPLPCEPEFDENGVDLAQIREMLDFTPDERLMVVQNFADSIAEIRALNGVRAVR